MNKRSLLLNLLIVTGPALVMPATAFAYTGKYADDCQACHGALKSGGGTVGGVFKALSSSMTASNILAAKGQPGMSFVDDAPAGSYTATDRNNIAAEVQAGAVTPPPPAANTSKPTLVDNLQPSYDAMVGDKLTLVLEAKDNDDDTVDVTAKPTPVGATITEGDLSANNNPTFNFDWTPAPGQENKVYKIKFTAKENATKQKYSSKPIATSIRVWPAGNRDQTSIKKFVLSSAKWSGDKLSLKGVIQFNKLLTKDEIASYMQDAPSMNFTLNQAADGSGAEIINLPAMVTTPKGQWSIDGIDLPSSSPQISCSVSMDFEGFKSSRKMAGAPKDCVKP